MPHVVNGVRDPTRENCPNFEKFKALIANLSTEYQSWMGELERQRAMYRVRQMEGGENVTHDLEKLKQPIIELEQDLQKHGATAEDIMRQYLEYSVTENARTGENLLHRYAYPPGVWNEYQTKLDAFLFQNNLPLADERFPPGYQQTVPHSSLVDGQHQSKQGAILSEIEFGKVIVLKDKSSDDRQILEMNEDTQEWEATWEVRCGPRLCGQLDGDNKNCIHSKTRTLTEAPPEWMDGHGWANGNPYMADHEVPHDVIPFKPYWGFVFQQLRPYED